MEKLFEALGRKQFQLDELNREYDQLLQLLANVVAGDIETSRVTVSLAERRWALADKKECFASGETNGSQCEPAGIGR